MTWIESKRTFLLRGVALLVLAHPSLAQIVNGGFEQANTNGWSIQFGTYNGNFTPDWTTTPSNQPPPLIVDANTALMLGQTLDVDPFEEDYMLRINDIFGGNHATRVSQAITLTAADLGAAFKVAWGAILENGNHTAVVQPFFSIMVLQNGVPVISFQADSSVAAQANSGWQQAGLGTSGGTLWYKDDIFQFLLSPNQFMAGDQLEVEMFVTDCSAGGHGGCAYLDSAVIGTLDCIDPPGSMVAWWNLDELTGGIAEDTVGTHDGSYGDFSSMGLPTPTPAKVSNGLRFLTGEHVIVPDHPELDFVADQDFSIDAWVKEDYDWADFDSNIVSKIGTANWHDFTPGYRFYMAGGPPEFVALDLSDGVTYSRYVAPVGIEFADQGWHHVAVTVDRDRSDGIKLYFDGAVVATFDATPMNVDLSNAEPLYVGNDTIGWGPPPGYRLDEIELFDRALGADEITNLFSADFLGKCRPCGPAEDDILEDNDSCNTAGILAPLSFANLFTSKFDSDWYRTSVPSNSALNIHTLFDHANGDIDVEFYGACNGAVIASGTSTDDDEKVVWSNTSSVAKNVYVHVHVKQASNQDCNTYNLTWWTASLPGGPVDNSWDWATMPLPDGWRIHRWL